MSRKKKKVKKTKVIVKSKDFLYTYERKAKATVQDFERS